MRVKRLELQGFKSFKDKTVINFDAGITGVVGPNGCGKSNVVDAFFWSLGEMNARNLRGQTMDDLIFSGSEQAPPGNMAEVNLILEVPADLSGPNAPTGASLGDAAAVPLMREVAITRRLYRSGESEYFLNRVPCRLRDIQELFMDTGAGARGYSIIQQGKIAEIVNAKPDERRTMIEDVAGVVKYKARRRESMRKLETTRQNLLRVTDILTEIERRKKQMERQAAKARNYKEWKEELQILDLRYSAHEWETFAGRYGDLTRKKEDLEAQETKLSMEHETADNFVSQKRLEAISAGKVSEECQQNWMHESQELSSSKSTLNYKQQSLEDLQESAKDLESEGKVEANRIQTLQEELEKAVKELETFASRHEESQAEKIRAEEASTEAKSELSKTESDYEQCNQSFLSVSSEATASEQKVINFERRTEELKAKIANAQTVRTEKESEINEVRSENETNKLASEASEKEVESIENLLDKITTIISETRDKVESFRCGLRELEAKRVRVESNLRSLEDQKKRHEGSGQGVRTIFQEILSNNEELKSKVNGTLADYITVAEGKEAAVEAALGETLEVVLTQDEATLLQLTEALKGAKKGRAAFADLSAIAGTQSPEGSSLPEFFENVEPLRKAISISTSENTEESTEKNIEALSQVLSLLLDGIYVVPNIQKSRSLAKSNAACTFVTRDGEVCRGAWYAAGGDKADVSGLIVQRNREIKELHTELSSLEIEISEKQAMLESMESKLSAENEQRAETETKREEKVRERGELRSNFASSHARLESYQKILEEMEVEAQESVVSLDSIQTESAQEQMRKIDLLQHKTEIQLELDGLKNRLPELRVIAENKAHALTEARIAEAALLEQRNSAESTKRNTEENLHRGKSRIEHLLNQAKDKRDAAERAIEGISELEEKVASFRQSIVASEEKYREAKEVLNKINAELEENRNASEEVIKQERKVSSRLNEVKLNIERIQLGRQSLSENVLDRYGVEIAEYVTEGEVQDQLEALRKQGEATAKDLEREVLRLREKIRKLGDVNTTAIEEYDELKERYDFLIEQKNDLEKSMMDLQNTIDRINEISKERFFRAYHEVNDKFQKVFPALFAGGQAQLKLTDPEDFVETGVDIMAQPPGKKLQNINLLSGGEKTLTAISLLFAIFLVKPSPFCLLDEVDAPLDDANIGRFNALLREMAKTSQFIIITHNKRTMELNDRLYGVTMEDAGVSKMVSIQLQ